jgi:hypothetical protein
MPGDVTSEGPEASALVTETARLIRRLRQLLGVEDDDLVRLSFSGVPAMLNAGADLVQRAANGRPGAPPDIAALGEWVASLEVLRAAVDALHVAGALGDAEHRAFDAEWVAHAPLRQRWMTLAQRMTQGR